MVNFAIAIQIFQQHVRPGAPTSTTSSVPLPPVPLKYACLFSKDPVHEFRAAQATHTLLCDYEDLISQAERLLGPYTDGMALLKNRAVMAEAAKSVAQVTEVTKLTSPVFVYIPLSFTTTFFGMNAHELSNWRGKGVTVSLWLWVVVSVPVMAFNFGLIFWHLRELWKHAKRMFVRLTCRKCANDDAISPQFPKTEDILECGDTEL